MIKYIRLQWLIALTVLTACSSDQASDKVTYNMAWLPQGSQAGIVAAAELGYYREAGLEVELARGFGAIRTANEIDQGMFDFGYADPLSVLLNRANGGSVRMVGSINTQWPAGLCFVVGRHQIESPADLAGLTVGGGQSSPIQVILPRWLEMNGVSRDSVVLLQMDPAVVDAALVEGTIDAGECWKGSNKAVVESRASAADVAIDWIEYSRFGLDLYGSGLVTSERMLTEHPDIVVAFVQATFRGYAWVISHPEEAADLMQRRFPVLDRSVTLQQVNETIQLLGDPESLGLFKPDRMQHTLEFLNTVYAVAKTVDPEAVYTNEFNTRPN